MRLSTSLLVARYSVVQNRHLKFAANLQGSQEGQKLGANFSKFAPIGIRHRVIDSLVIYFYKFIVQI